MSISALSDSELLALAQNLHSTIQALPSQYGLDAAFVTALNAANSNFDTNISAHVATQAAAKAQTANKNDSRDVVEGLVRDARVGAKAAKISEGDMLALGIPSGGQTAPPNATVPVAQVDTRVRLRHELSWTDAAFLGNKRKPRGVMGAEIWVKIDGPPPGNESDCTFLTLDAFTPYLAEYDPSEAGKTAHYMLRWRMRDGSVSGWGETESATITG